MAKETHGGRIKLLKWLLIKVHERGINDVSGVTKQRSPTGDGVLTNCKG